PAGRRVQDDTVFFDRLKAGMLDSDVIGSGRETRKNKRPRRVGLSGKLLRRGSIRHCHGTTGDEGAGGGYDTARNSPDVSLGQYRQNCEKQHGYYAGISKDPVNLHRGNLQLESSRKPDLSPEASDL